MDFKIILIASVIWMHSSTAVVNHETPELEDALPEEFLMGNCCSEGEYYSFDDCIFPSDKFQSKVCEETAKECCLKLHSAKNEKCESGIRRAKLTKNCTNLEEEDANRCCQDCVLGLTLGGSECENGPKVSQICCNYINQINKISTMPEEPPKIVPRKTRAPAVELNGCEIEGSQICAQKCIPNGSSYKCQCRNNYELMPDGFSCRRAVSNRCKNKCQQRCNEVDDKVICSCNRGYELNSDGITCKDINECESKSNPCKPGRKCVNTVGSYRCSIANNRAFGDEIYPPKNYPPPKNINCPDGYKLNSEKQACDDIDECLTNPCPTGKTCINNLGSFVCSESNGIRMPTNAPKKDVPVSSEEICPPGFRMHPEKAECVDVDECVEKTDDCNQNSQVCLNLPGSFICQNKASKTTCPPGFQMVHGSGCIDIDECVDQVCHKNEICENINGAYRCLSTQEGSVPAASQPSPEVPKASTRPPNKYKQQNCPKGYRRSINGGCVDIDECKENTHSCDVYQDCTNIMGGHRCYCKNGFKKDPITHACVDINECQEKTLSNCVEGQRCDNTIGSYQCIRYISCGTGYTLNAASSNCEDDDECLLGTHNCLEPQYYCINTRGSFKCVKHKVATTTLSTTTVVSSFLESDEYYEEYEDTSNYSNANQEVTPPINVEVEHKEHILTETTIPVANRESSPTQTRPIEKDQMTTIPTTSSTSTSTQEEFIPEENIGNDPKPDNNRNNFLDTTTMKNKVSMLIPVEKHCLLGYEMDGSGECNDIDECALEKILCDPHSEACQNMPGSYTCICAEGYTKDIIRKTCKKIPPVYLPPVVQLPRWSPIPHISCDIGMHMDPITKKCTDINECEGGVSKCAQGEICVNTLGGYTCKCAEGLHLVQGRCITIMPPAYTAPSRSITRSSTPVRLVTITRPPYRSHCPKGYILSDNNRCVDVDECSLRIHSCSSDQICVNVAGGYMCRCPKGHMVVQNNGATVCEDIDECKDSGGKVCPHYSTCRNTIGSYRCDCTEGFVSSPKSDQLCMDVDECAHNNGKGACHQKCINIWGSYRCACDHGFSLDLDNRTCVDIDECALAKRLCMGHCRNTPGNYHCTCPPGYKLGKDGKSCIDIDECDTGEMVCSSQEVCQNTRGGVRCHLIACPPGYTKDPQSSHRCSIIRKECPYADSICLSRPDTYSYNFVTFPSKLHIPTGPVRQVDLFTMKGPSMSGAMMGFKMRLIEVKAPPGVPPATIRSFKLTPSQQQASISLIESLTGPQDIHLELAMELFRDGMFEGTAVAKLLIFVSEYDF